MGHRPALGLDSWHARGSPSRASRNAAKLAEIAGRALLDLRANPPALRDIGAAGDRMAHLQLVAELNRLYPDDDVRSEEGLEHVAGFGRLWIVDPLDGTREFRQSGRSDWAVHVAMAVGGVAVVGAVALPALDLVLATDEPPVLPPFPSGEPPRMVVSRSRPPDVAYDVTEAIGGVMIPMGSAVAQIVPDPRCRRGLCGRGRAVRVGLVRPRGRRYPCGLHASRRNGDPLRYGDPDAWLPDLVGAVRSTPRPCSRSRRSSTGPTGRATRPDPGGTDLSHPPDLTRSQPPARPDRPEPPARPDRPDRSAARN